MKLTSPASFRLFLTLLACLLPLCFTLRVRADTFVDVHDADPFIDWPMIPRFAPPPDTVLIYPDLLKLWKLALKQDEGEVRRLTLHAILEAHALGAQGLESLVPDLLPMLSVEDKTNDFQPTLRHDAAEVLIALDDRQIAPRLLELEQSDGLDMILVVDPALAKWRYAPAGEVWLARIKDPDALPAARLTAINGLGELAYASAAPQLQQMVLDPAIDPAQRLAAAQALGHITVPGTPGLEDVAEKLIQPPSDSSTGTASAAAFDRLLAACVLGATRTSQAREILLALAGDSDPVVAGQALRGLFAWDPAIILPIAPQLLENQDATVRTIATQSLATRLDKQSLDALAPRLADLIPSIRAMVRTFMLLCAQDPTLRPQVVQQARSALHQSVWRAQEEGAFLTGKLQDRDSATTGRLVELIDSPRWEVRLASLTALRWLNDPSTYDAVFQRTKVLNELAKKAPTEKQIQEHERSDETKSMKGIEAAIGRSFNNGLLAPVPAAVAKHQHDIELAAAFEAMGTFRNQSAVPLASFWLPNVIAGYTMYDTRMSAFWAMGQLHTGNPETHLVATMKYAASAQGPETDEMRAAAMCALIQMGAANVLHDLEVQYPEQTPMIQWALHPESGPLRAGVQYHDIGYLTPARQ